VSGQQPPHSTESDQYGRERAIDHDEDWLGPIPRDKVVLLGRALVREGAGVGAAAMTPRLAEILAAMVDAVLDAEDAPRATRGTVAVRRPRAPRDRRPSALKRDARELQP